MDTFTNSLKPYSWNNHPFENHAARTHKPNDKTPTPTTNMAETIDSHSQKTNLNHATATATADKAVVVGAHGWARAQPRGTGAQEAGAPAAGSFHVSLKSSQANDGLGVYIGLVDSSVGFRANAPWGGAIAMGVHAGNLFEWADAKADGALVRGALDGYAESPTDGSVVSVQFDLASNYLAFKVNGGDWMVAKNVELPASARPFVKLGSTGDSIALSYAERPPKAMPMPQVSQMKISSFAPVRESGDSVMDVDPSRVAVA